MRKTRPLLPFLGLRSFRLAVDVPMQLVADTGDTSADGEDLVTADEAVEQGGDDLLG